MYPLSASTSGGTAFTIVGENFGLNPRVRVDGMEWSLDNGTTNHTHIVVVTSPGEGVGMNTIMKCDAMRLLFFSCGFDNINNNNNVYQAIKWK